MNEATRNDIDAVEAGLRQWESLKAECARLHNSNQQWEHAYHKAETENQLLRHRVTALEGDLIQSRRYATELTTRLTDIGRLIEASLTAARQHAYRPDGAVRDQEPPMEHESAIMGGLTRALRLDDRVPGFDD